MTNEVGNFLQPKLGALQSDLTQRGCSIQHLNKPTTLIEVEYFFLIHEKTEDPTNVLTNVGNVCSMTIIFCKLYISIQLY